MIRSYNQFYRERNWVGIEQQELVITTGCLFWSSVCSSFSGNSNDRSEVVTTPPPGGIPVNLGEVCVAKGTKSKIDSFFRHKTVEMTPLLREKR